MYKSLLTLLILVIFLTACGAGKQKRRGPLNTMSVTKMFPGDRQAQALALAASDGNIKRIDKLIARGADVNAIGEYGVTLPCWILYHPNKAGFKRLLEHGADPNIIWTDPKRVDVNNSLIHEATCLFSLIGAEYLQMALGIGKGDPNLQCESYRGRPIKWALNRSDQGAFVVLYNAGAEIDYSSYFGETLVSDAVMSGNFEIAYFMLQQGVNFWEKNKRGGNIRNSIESNFKMGRIQRLEKKNDPQCMWFWRCVNFLEEQGMIFDIPPDVRRPAVLESSPPEILSKIKKR